MIEAKAIRLTGETSIEALTIDTLSLPEPSPHQVLVGIKAVSLNYRDFLVVTGRYSPNLPKPLIICSDGAGEVLAVGSEVSRFKVGDRVAGTFFQNWITGEFDPYASKSALGGAIDGVLTSHRLLDEQGVVLLPEGLSFEEGATLPCAAVTAWHSLVSTAKIKSGDTVLLLGTGGVSIFALQIAKAHGAKVILTSSSEQKLARAKALGADQTINYKEIPEWGKEVQKLTEGRGVDVVVEVGGSGTLPQSLRATRYGGQVSLIGVLSGISSSLNIGPILHGNLRLQGIYVGSRQMFEELNRSITINKIKPVIDKVFPFEEVKEALSTLEKGQHFGKLVLQVAK